jgi:hypothetical protein
VAPKNPTLRKNNPWKQKVWEDQAWEEKQRTEIIQRSRKEKEAIEKEERATEKQTLKMESEKLEKKINEIKTLFETLWEHSGAVFINARSTRQHYSYILDMTNEVKEILLKIKNIKKSFDPSFVDENEDENILLTPNNYDREEPKDHPKTPEWETFWRKNKTLIYDQSDTDILTVFKVWQSMGELRARQKEFSAEYTKTYDLYTKYSSYLNEEETKDLQFKLESDGTIENFKYVYEYITDTVIPRVSRNENQNEDQDEGDDEDHRHSGD